MSWVFDIEPEQHDVGRQTQMNERKQDSHAVPSHIYYGALIMDRGKVPEFL